jgi:hypothetical protein
MNLSNATDEIRAHLFDLPDGTDSNAGFEIDEMLLRPLFRGRNRYDPIDRAHATVPA